jgi:hypothetical protein
MVFLLFTVGSVSLSLITDPRHQCEHISVFISSRRKKKKVNIPSAFFFLFLNFVSLYLVVCVVVLSAFDVFTHQVRCVAAEAKRIRKVNDHKQMIRFIIDLLDGMKECWGASYTVCKVRRLCTP